MSSSRSIWLSAHAAVVIAFLVAVGSYYRAPFGFTEFIQLPADHHDGYELAAITAVPHVENADGGYDGQYYARLAIEPLLRNPDVDRTLDLPAYRARRILFSWTAHALGLGRPAWILEAFALQNVLAWLVLAWLLLRWFPVGSARAFALWAGCLLTHGMLSSVGNALLDAPSALLLTIVIVAIERGRSWVAALVLGLSGLARETNLLGLAAMGALMTPWARTIPRAIGWTVVALLPVLLWTDYLRSIYHHQALATAGAVTTPLLGLAWKLSTIVRDLESSGLTIGTVFNVCAVAAFVVQVAFLVWVGLATWREPSAWLLLAAAFGALGVSAHQVVWAGTPGAITRVVLPMTIGFNVLGRNAPWPVLVVGNLGIVPGVLSFMFRM